ncbi:hypothetical protein MSAN_02243800 [Mycena sanguinolenta]|uniref:BHLH domain-containing protein n=1 Tax=Mycena sanguinolenta TaxID=230812 RepID=A0A8H6XAX5_9AGAR|nr:hypothetical protein MSAN_02243800 [Mycena sanguinolenta]
MSPRPPYPDFEFNFNPSGFPNPPPLPSSAALFSAAETTDLLGFLDNFNDFGWENDQQSYSSPRAPYSNPHLNTAPEPSTSGRPRRSTRSATRVPTQQQLQQQHEQQQQKEKQQQQSRRQPQRREISPRRDSQTPSNASETSSSHANDHSSSGTSTSASVPPAPAPVPVPRGSKPLLSTPQKRLNHIMSEQKRRNAIRDGYAQLIALLAPAGSAPGIGMPQRGRPKGSGSRGKGQSKGKSGVLFRAVEYIRWLEEGRNAMREEVLRVEAAAGIRDGAGKR